RKIGMAGRQLPSVDIPDVDDGIAATKPFYARVADVAAKRLTCVDAAGRPYGEAELPGPSKQVEGGVFDQDAGTWRHMVTHPSRRDLARVV
ncbi:hypothetical protein, partial [Clostridium perfringens]